MKNKSLKLLFISVLILVSFFSFLFLNNKVQAQSGNAVTVSTTQYSFLNATTFVLGGAYHGNNEKKPFTTYFEYKKDNSDLTVATDRQETIKIVRDSNVDESNVFYSSPSLQIDSTYYFRAVGYFNDNPSQRFYGSVLSFRTGAIYTGTIPFSVYQNNTVVFYTPSSCVSSTNLENGECVNATPPVCNPSSQDLINGICRNKISSSCEGSEVLNYSTNNCFSTSNTTFTTLSPFTSEPPSSFIVLPSVPTPSVSTSATPPSVSNTSNSNTDTDETSGLVVCTKNCDFNDLMNLINRVIRFILFSLAIPISAIMFAYAGFLLVTAGGGEAKTRAKSIFSNTVMGLIFAAGAWLIIRTILSVLGYDGVWIGF